MEDELKKKWIKALRSKRYKQTDSQLRKEPSVSGEKTPSYCCLGVLCQVMRVPYNKDEGAYRFKFDGDGGPQVILEGGQLPGQFASNLGLTKKVTNRGERVTLQDKLIDFNDHKNKSFEDIADYLEKVNF